MQKYKEIIRLRGFGIADPSDADEGKVKLKMPRIRG
jgi:hypothetical protein